MNPFMLYHAYEMQRAFLTGASAMASASAELLANPALGPFRAGPGSLLASALDVFAHAAAPRGKPMFGISSVERGGQVHAVTTSLVVHRPFGNLLRFSHEGLGPDAPRVLLVAPMSGHFATLLRGTVARLVANAVVYITDWADARMVPLEEGRFDLDDYIDYLIDFLGHVGPGAHMVAVCQPSVPALAATALMAEDGNPCRPLTLTMMGGPIDTREAPTSVNDLAMRQPLSWFENTVIAKVPLSYPGAGRRVYPGFLQLAGFMAMNLGNHMMSHYRMFRHLVEGDGESADATKAFYEEYRSVCDLNADYYLQTIDRVFQRYALPRGEFEHRGRPVNLSAIRDTALLAVEGENDDISGIGQTRAALNITPALDDTKKRYFLAPKVGHYGIFNGGRWRTEIAPVLEDWFARHAARAETGGAPILPLRRRSKNSD